MQYNGEYAKQGEDWPPAEAFAEQPAEQPAAAAPPQQQSAASSGASSNRTTARTRHTQSAREVLYEILTISQISSTMLPRETYGEDLNS